MTTPTPGLYLIPTPLGDEGLHTLPSSTLALGGQLTHFVVESEKSARRFLLAAWRAGGLSGEEARARYSACTLKELSEHTPDADIPGLLQPAFTHPLGLLSDAGVPAVADPGGRLVAAAHAAGIAVHPLVGPSSLLLALMASGLNGQGFTFHGYPPREAPARKAWIQKAEAASASSGFTQLCIETPYRNGALLSDLMSTLHPDTRLCTATDLSLPTEEIRMLAVAAWRKKPLPDLQKRPTVFLFLR